MLMTMTTTKNMIVNQINALRIMKNECKIAISSSWGCWIPGIGKPCPFYMDLKTIMDKELPKWENLERSFTVPQYQSCFYKIDQIVKEKLTKPMSTLGDFLQ